MEVIYINDYQKPTYRMMPSDEMFISQFNQLENEYYQILNKVNDQESIKNYQNQCSEFLQLIDRKINSDQFDRNLKRKFDVNRQEIIDRESLNSPYLDSNKLIRYAFSAIYKSYICYMDPELNYLKFPDSDSELDLDNYE